MTILETRCEVNLQWAKWASRKTRTILHRGPANRPYRPEHESLLEYADLRMCVHDVKSQTGSLGPSGWEKHIADAAELAIRHHCGNCGEHAAVAFMLLKDENVRPLDFIGMRDGDWSHNFVVIGRERHRQRPLRPGSTEEVIRENPRAWGPNAIVCDPYNDACYPAHELPQMRPKDPVLPKSYLRMS